MSVRPIFRLLAAASLARLTVSGPARVEEMPAVPRARSVRRTSLVAFTAAARTEDVGWLDASAGCEFVDDRIRSWE